MDCSILRTARIGRLSQPSPPPQDPNEGIALLTFKIPGDLLSLQREHPGDASAEAIATFCFGAEDKTP